MPRSIVRLKPRDQDDFALSFPPSSLTNLAVSSSFFHRHGSNLRSIVEAGQAIIGVITTVLATEIDEINLNS